MIRIILMWRHISGWVGTGYVHISSAAFEGAAQGTLRGSLLHRRPDLCQQLERHNVSRTWWQCFLHCILWLQYRHFKHCIGADDDARKILKYCVHNRSHFPHICRVFALLWNPAPTAYCGALWESPVLEIFPQSAQWAAYHYHCWSSWQWWRCWWVLIRRRCPKLANDGATHCVLHNDGLPIGRAGGGMVRPNGDGNDQANRGINDSWDGDWLWLAKSKNLLVQSTTKQQSLMKRYNTLMFKLGLQIMYTINCKL